MCLIVLAWKIHPEFDLVVGANRDEFYARPTRHAEFWPESPQVLAGRDLESGGTWLGITRGGRFAAVTNYREGQPPRAGARTRGELPQHFLQSTQSAESYAHAAYVARHAYSGFNLLLGDGEDLWYCGSRSTGARRLLPGIYGLSNHLLDTEWPKVKKSKSRFAAALQQAGFEAPLLELLADRQHASDEELPDTGIAREWERALSSTFIVSPAYGTRAISVLAQKGERFRFLERSFGVHGQFDGEKRFEG